MNDRRIPPIRQAIAPQERGNEQFPGFDSDLAAAFGRNDPWVLAADLPAPNLPGGSENQLLWSVVIPSSAVETVLQTEEWEAAFDSVGYPSFWSQRAEVVFEENTTGRGDVALAPFTIYRSSHGYRPAYFELAQGFVLYHALVDDGAGTLFRIEDDGRFSEVVRIEQIDGRQRVFVERAALLDYLSAKQSALVRYRDHRKPLLTGAPTGVHQSLSDGEAYTFRYQALASDIGIDIELAYLHGKDVIVPPAFPTATHRIRAGVEQSPREYQDFVIGVDANGDANEQTSNGGLLSSYFRDTGRTHYLTPVWFRSDVLDRYYRDNRYSIEGSLLRCLDLWSLQIDRVTDGLVQVWLGDLGNIPLLEQHHWRGFNVPPPANVEISEARYQTDFEGNFAEAMHDPLYLFNRAFKATQDASNVREGEPLFRPLGPGDEHIAAGLRIPFNDDTVSFDEQILNLAKLTADSINESVVQTATGLRIDRTNGPFSLAVLERYLVVRGMEEGHAKDIIRPLRTVQRLRSAGAAHRRGAGYTDEATRLAPGAPSRKAFRKVLEDVTATLDAIAEAIPHA